ncbi:extracellular solute-binding protein [Lederbergia wuyishanensis]|uniref:Aldouronate transport system substrate-binding protein n=1 Tax=Lederbergia wuyishanensis TaxID=1347903 RepID=A0ABU0D5K3_9BACI|nr:extracellular solute-binding protein [Lederbergia wuyishanensis]MCJ8009828.1 extracellular solute-binding protein [Lederbergia wuyishanensis]MDQ0343684.1 putative aldouronate transport system substrate-binding protein [Lederbergia wuyishanensis]
MKKTVWSIILVLLLTAALSGCKSGSKPSNEANSQDGEGKPTEVEWFIAADWYNRNWDPVNNALDKLITENTGLTFKITTGNEEKLSAMIASNQLPDMITVGNSAPQRKMLENSGMLAPLDELIKEYAPSYDVPQSMQDWFRNEDGHFYGFVNFFYPEEKMQEGDAFSTHTAMYARADIMEQLGIKQEDFETKEGTIAALKKVKEANLEYNGFKVIPAYFSTSDIAQFFGAGKVEDEEGNLIKRSEANLEAIKFLNELYREGLLPEDSVTLTEDQIGEKVAAGAVFAFTGGRVASKTRALPEADPNASFTPIGPIKGDHFNGDLYILPNSLSGWTMTSINANSKYKEKIVKAFEFLSSDEMSINAKYGPKGITWDYDEQGNVQYLPDVKKEVDEDYEKAKLKYGMDTFEWFMTWLPIARTMPEPKTPYEKYIKEGSEHFDSFSYNALAYEATRIEGGTPESSIKVKVDDFTGKAVAEMILAKSGADVDKKYEKMIKDQEKLGFEKLYEYQNKEFKEAKERLGVKYIWPEYQDKN